MGYKDKTFCPFYESCKTPCDRALTEEVMTSAIKWWGNSNVPVEAYSEKPSCHVKK